MSFIQNLFTSRDNNANSASYVGQQDRLWYDPVTNALYVSDGSTPGGIPVSGGGSGNGVPGGPTNSVQLNAGGGNFGGTTNLTFSNGNLLVDGNVIITGELIANISGNINLGNLVINDETITGVVNDRDITIDPTGVANVNLWGKLVVSPDGQVVPFANTTVGFTPVALFSAPDGQASTIHNSSFSDLNPSGAASYVARRYSGTKTAPTAVVSGQTLGTFVALGFDGTGFQPTAYSGIIFTATENFSPTHQGTAMEIRTIPAGSNVTTTVATFNNDSVTIGDFNFQGDQLTIANSAANITIGNVIDTGFVQFNRPVEVFNVAATAPVFQVDQTGYTEIRVPTPDLGQAAVKIIGGTSGNEIPLVSTATGGMLHITGPDNGPTLLTIDNFDDTSPTASGSAIVLRRLRGTVDAPTAIQANDRLGSLSAAGYGDGTPYSTAGFPAAAQNTIVFRATENYSNIAFGAQIEFNAVPNGTATSQQVMVLNPSGPTPGINLNTAGTGIKFSDGSFQNTAYLTSNSVSSLAAGQGINLSGSTGDITVTNTGILGIVGTPNRVLITSNVAGVVTLSTPQDLTTNANVSFNNLTVNNLSIVGNVSNVIPNVVEGSIIYVANTATTYNDINNSGLVTGNIANGYWAGMLYDTSLNAWKFDLGNSLGVQAGNLFSNYGRFDDTIHIGYANATIDYPNASLQADCNIDSYNQVVIQNHYQGANASGDFVAVANNGDDGNNYIDMGINSNVYSNSDYAVTGPNDGYLYVNGGNLVVGTQTPTNIIKFFTGGTNSTSRIRAIISDSGLSVTGNILANNSSIIANSYIGSTFSVLGNITGGNLLTAGLLSTTGTISGSSIFGGVISGTGNVTGANLRASGTISATGNIVGGNIITANIVSSGSLSTAGNITGGNLLAISNVSASGNVTATYLIASVSTDTVNLNATGFVSVAGNVTGGNIRTVGLVSATGNITGNYFFGNGAQLTGLNAYGNVYANGVAVLAGNGSAALTMTPGNNQVITGNNTSKTLTIAVNDNPTFATLSVTGNITVSGNVIAANTSYTNVANIVMSNSAPLGTAISGMMEYDGRVLYFTPQDQERGVTPSQQWYVLNADRGLTFSTTTPQSLFGVGPHLSNSTRYWFRIKAYVSRGTGTNNTSLTLGWRGTATMSRISFSVQSSMGAFASVKASYIYENTLVSGFTNQETVSTTNNPPDSTNIIITGIIDVGASGAGTVEPYISWTGAAAAGSVTVGATSNFQVYPLGVVATNTQVGNWS